MVMMYVVRRTHNRGLLVLVLMFVAILSAQEHSGNGARKNSFTNTDGTFKFEYPPSLVRCANDPKQHDQWNPPESCEAYTPVCSDSAEASSETISCVAYPAEDMKATNFEATAFAVRGQKAMTTNAECLKIEEPPPHGQARKENVNGVIFTVVKTDGVATGNLSDGYTYRTFHGSKCYELDIRIAFANIGNYPPDTVKSFDAEKVLRALKAVLMSFKFLR